MAMSTYFHPNNKDGVLLSAKKYGKIIKDNDICKKAVKVTPLSDFDILRKTAFFFIKIHAYPFLKVIASMKQYMLKKGKYNY